MEEGEIADDVHRSVHKEKMKAVKVGGHNNPTILFVSNMPEGCSRETLLKTFEVFGEVFDIYVAKKKDKAGRNFGFVKFRSVNDRKVMEDSVKNIMLENRRVIVFKAKFDRSGNRMETSSTWNRHTTIPNLSRGEDPINRGSGRSYLDALSMVLPSSKSITIPAETFAFSENHKKALIGRVLDFKTLLNIHPYTGEFQPKRMGIKYLGGFYIILSFSEPSDTEDFLMRKEIWNKWFSSLDHWIGQSVQFERIAWVRILGVPSHLWDRSVIDSIGSKFGKVIQGSQITWDDRKWSHDCNGLLMKDGNQVREDIDVHWRDKSYRVWIIEEPGEWLPDCLENSSSPMSSTSKDDFHLYPGKIAD